MPGTIPELLRARAEARPEAVACCRRASAGRWLPTSWRDLWAEVTRAAAALRAAGLARGDRLAVLAPTSREWFVVEAAGLLAGAAIVGIDPHAPTAQTEFLLDHCGARALVVDRSERAVPLRSRPKLVVSLEAGEGALLAGILRWQEFLGGQPDTAAPPEEPPTPDDVAAVITTAGTTGEPKGIEYSHRQVLVACLATLEAFPQIRAGEAMLCWLPMAHLFQRMMNLFAAARGMVMYFVEDPRTILECAGEVEPSTFIGVPRFYEKLYEGIQARLGQVSGWRRRLVEAALAAGAERARAQRQGASSSLLLRWRHALLDRLVLAKVRRVMGRNLKFLITGTAPTPPWLLEFFHGLGWLVLEAYGLSENTVPMAANRPDAYRFGSVGLPFPANELAFAEDGEILVRGPGVMHGYLGDPPGTGSFTAEGYYRTGDYGRIDADGFLYLQGRKSDLIKTSTGRRVAPARVEAAYQQSPCLDQVVVFGAGRKHLVALLTLNPQAVAAALRRAGEPVPDADQLAGSAAVRDLVRRELETCGQELAPHERVLAFAILPAPLSVAEEELTPTLKLRRNHIARRHASLIESLYQGQSGAALTVSSSGPAEGGR